MASKPSSRGRLASIPAEHDVLGHPELRDQQGGPNGETAFRQIAASTVGGDITKSKPKDISGKFKFSPGA